MIVLHLPSIPIFDKASSGRRSGILIATLIGDGDMASKRRYMMSESTYTRR